MSGAEVVAIVEQVERLLAETGPLPEAAQLAIGKLLNVVEALSADRKELADELARLRKQLEQKKKAKTTAQDASDGKASPPRDNDHSSEKRRRQCERQTRRKARDRRSFKDLTIHETVECPVDPALLPPETVRLEDEVVIVQGIEIKPKNSRFQRQVFYSPSQGQTYRGPLPRGC